MGIKLLFCLFFITKFNVIKSSDGNEKFSVGFQWNFINYTWESPEALEEAKSSGRYVPGEDVIAGIKIYKDVIYLALPRVKKSASVTLASIPMKAAKENPLLSPYPSWDMNCKESCETIQNVLSMEIDKEGIMWVLDARRVDKHTKCPPRIILLDLNKNGIVVQNFVVPDELCPHNDGCFLNDIVVDGDFAYMSDTTKVDSGIFVYNRKLNKAWKFRDETMRGDPSAEIFTAQGVVKKGLEHINGIALSPNCGGNRTFYYMPQSSFNIFSISTAVLKNPNLTEGNVAKYITNHGRKKGQSGGMVCDNKDYIYYGVLPLDSVYKWDTSKSLEDSTLVEQNSEIIKWPDSFSFDLEGNMFLITNGILYFSKNQININETNFRIIKLHTGTQSYFYC